MEANITGGGFEVERLSELKDFARQEFVAMIRGDQEARRQIATLVDILVLGSVPPWTGATDLKLLQEVVLSEVFSATVRLKVAPPDTLSWIRKKIADACNRRSTWLAADRDRAADLQQRMFPPRHFALPGLEVAFGLRPFDALSGDLFDYAISRSGNEALVLVGDVMGKGSDAGLLTAFILGQFRALSTYYKSPRRLTDRLGASLNVARGSGSEYATVIIARWQASKRVLTVCNAGHLYPYLVSGKKVVRVDVSGQPAGISAKGEFGTTTLKPSIGDFLLMTSDGISEQGSFLRKLARQLGADSSLSASQVVEKGWRAVNAIGKAPHDDRIIAVLRFV